MGEGSHISLINATPYTWHKVYEHQYQMNAWGFPEVINSGELAQVYIELGSGNQVDNAAEVNYTVADPSTTAFQVQLRTGDDGDPSLSVYLESMSTGFSHLGETIPIGWYHNGVLPWIVSGPEGTFGTNALPANWMQDNIATIGCQPLRRLCMPASHDAGMSSPLNGHTAFSNEQNTITQNLKISDQLSNGARYFDIRPVVAAGQFVTGHYSEVGPLGWQGGNGQSIDEIIGEVNDFLATNQELVIMDLTHCLDTDSGYPTFTQGQWTQLMTKLKDLKNLFVAPPGTSDLGSLALRDFIGTSAAVVIIIDQTFDDGSPVDLGPFEYQGFYNSSQLSVYNKYADTDDEARMEDNQIAKLRENRPNPDAPLFLLSWTITQDGGDVNIVGRSIIDLAQRVFPDLFTSKFWGALSKDTYPNFIMVDDYAPDRRLAALVVAINKFFTGGCP